MTAKRHPHRPKGGRVMTALHHAGRTIWYVNDELSRASEAMIRSARFPQPPGTSAGAKGASAPAEKLAVPDRSSATATSATSRARKDA
jgi:hypothetical protein